jgi:hypothetical protein
MARHTHAPSVAVVAITVMIASVAASEPVSWGPYKQGVQSMRAGASADTVGEQLGPVMDWTYDGSLETVRRGQAFMGPNNRMRRVMAKMLAREPIEVAVLGGSISTGEWVENFARDEGGSTASCGPHRRHSPSTFPPQQHAC